MDVTTGCNSITSKYNLLTEDEGTFLILQQLLYENENSFL